MIVHQLHSALPWGILWLARGVVGWLVEATHGSSHSPRTQPSEDVIADPPRQFLVVRLPQKKETGPKRTEPDDRIPEANCTHSSPLFLKNPRRCQTRFHTSSSSSRDKASRAPRTATSPKSSVGIAAGSELGPTPSSHKTCSTRPRSANAGCITVAAPVRYMCKLNNGWTMVATRCNPLAWTESGWWFGTFFIFPYCILGIIIPTD